MNQRNSQGALTILIDFDIHHNEFCIGGNVKFERVHDLICGFLRCTSLSAGVDDSEREVHDLYKIDIEIDLSYDIFRCNHNCGNLGLRDGILLHLLAKLSLEQKTPEAQK